MAAREIWRFAVTIPAGTLQAAPLTTALRLPSREIGRVEVVVPPGPRGEVGFQLASGGVQMIPVNSGQFVVTDDERLGWDLVGQITSGAWQMIAYNTGSFPHTLEVRLLADLVPDPATLAGFAPLSSAALSSGV